jgi:hypothetical protein
MTLTIMKANNKAAAYNFATSSSYFPPTQKVPYQKLHNLPDVYYCWCCLHISSKGQAHGSDVEMLLPLHKINSATC